jgi:hypothetical protein
MANVYLLQLLCLQGLTFVISKLIAYDTAQHDERKEEIERRRGQGKHAERSEVNRTRRECKEESAGRRVKKEV